MWGKENTCVLSVGMQIGAATMKSVCVCVCVCVCVYLKKTKTLIQKDICTPVVHCSTIYNGRISGLYILKCDILHK